MSRRRHAPRGVARVALVLLVATCAACAVPVPTARGARDYELKAHHTADTVLSAVNTARLVAQAASRGDAYERYVRTALTDAEDTAGGAEATFGAIQPPDERSDALRDELLDIVADATDVIAELRIASRRGQLSRLASIAEPLAEVAHRLEVFSEQHG